MQLKNENHSFVGMQRDIDISKHPSNFLYDAQNIRLTSREGDTLLSITNEKGTKDINVRINGTYLGHCLLNQYLVIFSTDKTFSSSGVPTKSPDYINRVDLSKDGDEAVKLLFSGDLQFSPINNIDAIASYENESIQKVYWVDGKNQPRMINIAPSNDGIIEKYNESYFDFIPELKLQEDIYVKKLLGASGEFAPGVIQYAFTYYRKYGQESNIFYTTPLYYISHKDRGASPEDKVANSFEINLNHIDSTFDYLRIYSIQRTSINSTPICKRVQDINISSMDEDEDEDGNDLYKKGTFIDTGTIGDIIDPTELLYKGGEVITAITIEQKDNTLFFGNIMLSTPEIHIDDKDLKYFKIEPSTRDIYNEGVSSSNYSNYNQLTAWDSSLKDYTVPCSGFKNGNYYRLGIQFQYKNGRWSRPFLIEDKPMDVSFSEKEPGKIAIPVFKCTISKELLNKIPEGFVKARAIVVYPENQDRVVLCQGIVNPTLFTNDNRNISTIEGVDIEIIGTSSLYAQSSWFFRAAAPVESLSSNKICHSPMGNSVTGDNTNNTYLPYQDRNGSSSNIKSVEIQGHFNKSNKFRIDNNFITLHSPDIEFGEQSSLSTSSESIIKKVGNATIKKTSSDINIQTETPTFGSSSGFIHTDAVNEGNDGIISGLFYSDYILDDFEDRVEKVKVNESIYSPVYWMVYAWNKNGSLNNDFNRPANLGVQSAVLKKKVISNLRYCTTEWLGESVKEEFKLSVSPDIYSDGESSIIKLGSKIYKGNIDTLLSVDNYDGSYFGISVSEGEHALTVDVKRKTFCSGEDSLEAPGIYIFNSLIWEKEDLYPKVGKYFIDIAINSSPIRMKYKSTPHVVVDLGSDIQGFKNLMNGDSEGQLAIAEIRNTVNKNLLFGGKSKDALQANVWIPCGEPVLIDRDKECTIEYSWGDTYYQRYDCLKTYPFTSEDPNQIVEIGSFMLETYINIDGRYDRNRGQINNLNVTPQNFNLINPVYSQLNNFFTYRILDDDYYKNNNFPNQIIWTKEKQSGADVDLWTNITLASNYDMDGSKGGVVSLNTWKDQLFCFQNKGVSNILFNSRVQIPVSDGVPIEITNSYKVDGYRYLYDGIGCNNKLLIKETPIGIYFIDSVSNHLYLIGENSSDISLSHNMSRWFKEAGNNEDCSPIDKIVYDDVNHDIYLVQNDKALCYSEVLNQFTSFMDYGGVSLIESYNGHVFTLKDQLLYEMFKGDYNNFFGELKPWHFTFISNGIDSGTTGLDKIFSNIDYRMDMQDTDNDYQHFDSLDYIRVVNEYQDTGEVPLNIRKNATNTRFVPGISNIQKKFRIWRIQIPRNHNSLDRIRNTWCSITLGKNVQTVDRSNFDTQEEYNKMYKQNTQKAVLHDLNVLYYL